MLKDEHADVTISKIRFFESQGLIAPERTPSGYRKFYDRDIDRLRWILVQQRDNFLPLKVIKRRLEEAGFDPATDVASAGPLPEPTLFTKPSAGAGGGPRGADTKPPAEAGEPVAAPESEPAGEDVPEPEPDPGPVAAEVPAAPAVADGDPLSAPAGSVSLTALELAEAAGVDLGLIADLERLGLIESIATDDTVIFDHEAMVVARAAGVFKARGAEPRHLRMFKVAAERQAGVLEQLVSPKLKKGGEDQRVARAELNELVQLGESIQRSILRRSFGRRLD